MDILDQLADKNAQKDIMEICAWNRVTVETGPSVIRKLEDVTAHKDSLEISVRNLALKELMEWIAKVIAHVAAINVILKRDSVYALHTQEEVTAKKAVIMVSLDQIVY